MAGNTITIDQSWELKFIEKGVRKNSEIIINEETIKAGGISLNKVETFLQ